MPFVGNDKKLKLLQYKELEISSFLQKYIYYLTYDNYFCAIFNLVQKIITIAPINSLKLSINDSFQKLYYEFKRYKN